MICNLKREKKIVTRDLSRDLSHPGVSYSVSVTLIISVG